MQGRVARTEVGEHDQPSSGKAITTDYDWAATEEGEVATVTRGGHVSTLTFDDGRLATARTPLGHWEYTLRR